VGLLEHRFKLTITDDCSQAYTISLVQFDLMKGDDRGSELFKFGHSQLSVFVAISMSFRLP
jgi:hypothetical protein